MNDEPEIELVWRGEAASARVVRALATARVRLVSASQASALLPAIVATKLARKPVAPAQAARWLWLCNRPVSLALAREAIAAGAYDVLALSEDAGLDPLCARARELAVADAALPSTPGLVANSAAARAMLGQLAHAARTSMPVLITGETGTGKEEAASLVHNWSARRDAAYVPVNCAAIPNELMESELFGHTRGAFSGAVASVDGRLLAAAGGTVFLDEIDDTPLSTQVKLLRVLEDGEVTRLGETRGKKVDFRIVAATNRDLLALIADGSFGLDFYERLAIVRVELPPLRARKEDIAALCEHFIAGYFERERLPRRVHSLSPLALEALHEHDWPGNVRELRNVVFSSLVNKRAGDSLLLSDLPVLNASAAGKTQDSGIFDRALLRAQLKARRFNLREQLAALERAALEEALEITQHSPTRAAQLLGEVGRGKSHDPGGTVRAMMRRHELDRR